MTKLNWNTPPKKNELPSGWKRRRLRFDGQINPKKSSLRVPFDTIVSFVPMEAIGEHGTLDLSDTRELGDVYDGYTYFADGDVCLAKITPCFENGKGALAEGLKNGIGFGTTELHVIRTNSSVDQRFMYYISVADDFRKIGESEMYGAGGQKRISECFIKDWMPPLPPLETQQRIAQFLDEKTANIDALIEKKRELLTRLAEKRQALITRAVTKGLNPDAPMKPSGIDWLGDIPAHWDVLPLKRVLSSSTYGISASLQPHGEFAILRMGNLENGEIDFNELRFLDDIDEDLLLEPRDVIFNRTNSLDLVGKTSVFCGFDDYPVSFASYLVRFRFYKNYVPEYANYIMGTKELLDLARTLALRSIGQANLNPSRYAMISFPVPSVHEQTIIVSLLDNYNKKFSEANDKIAKSINILEEYRSCIVTSAVTGLIKELT